MCQTIFSIEEVLQVLDVSDWPQMTGACSHQYGKQHDIIEPLLKTSYVRFFLWVYLNTGEASPALVDANVPSNTRIWKAMARLTGVVSAT
jgi:hypothetical protein